MGTISKALALLGEFTPDRPEIGLGEFVRLTKRDKATVHRHLSELAENGFLEQNPKTRAYRLGPAVMRLAALRETMFPIRKLMRPIVLDLSEAVGELAHASLLQNGSMSALVHADPMLHGVQVHFDISEILPLHATSSGLAALAFCPDDLRDDILARPLIKHTARTPSDPNTLREVISEVQRVGLCTLSGAFEDGVSSVGAPVFGDGRQVIGALAVAVPTARATPDRLREIASHVLQRAKTASVTLGGDFPDSLQKLPPNWGDAALSAQE